MVNESRKNDDQEDDERSEKSDRVSIRMSNDDDNNADEDPDDTDNSLLNDKRETRARTGKKIVVQPSGKTREGLSSTVRKLTSKENVRGIAGPPDGGTRAWMIMIGSFLINGVLFSVINTFSLIYLDLQKRLIEAGETEASSKAALVGSLTIGTTFFLSPVAGILTDKIGIQLTTFIGGAIAASGMFLSSLFTDKVEVLYLTYGVMYGLGASLAYTPSLVILGHYFKRYLGLVNGIVTAGSAVFTTLLPYLTDTLLKRFGLEGTLRSLSILTAIVMACAVLFKPLSQFSRGRRDESNEYPHPTLSRNHSLDYSAIFFLKLSKVWLVVHSTTAEEPVRRSKSSACDCFGEIINVSIWKRKKYVVWASAIPLALFGYFVPYVHIGKFVANVFPSSDGKLPVMCVGITSGIGRLVFGYIADLPRVDRILLQQVSFLSIGVLTMLLPVTKSFTVLLLISLCMGLFDGCFISLLGPIAFDICGRDGATQAIGFLLGMCSIPLTVGPPIAGLLYDHTGSYDLPFLLAGVPPIVGALAMFAVKCVKEDKNQIATTTTTTTAPRESDPAEQSLTNSTWQNGSRFSQCKRNLQASWSIKNSETLPLIAKQKIDIRRSS